MLYAKRQAYLNTSCYRMKYADHVASEFYSPTIFVTTTKKNIINSRVYFVPQKSAVILLDKYEACSVSFSLLLHY